MAVSQAELVQVYLAYFGRPPDPIGLNFYLTGNFTLQEVLAQVSASSESRALYGDQITYEQIDAIYQNVFGRNAEDVGKLYWYSLVVKGQLSAAGVALAILQGAQNYDKEAVENKLAASTAFLNSLDTSAEIMAYSGTTAAAAARAFLKSVDSSSTSLYVALQSLATPISFSSAAPSPGSVPAPATTFILTEADNAVTLSGTSSDAFVYTINGAATRAGTAVAASSGSLTNSVISFNATGYAGTATITLNAAGNTVTGGSADDIIKVLSLVTTGTINGGTGSNTIEVRDGANISGSNVSNIQGLKFDATGVNMTNDVTMTSAQYLALTTITAAGVNPNQEKIILTTPVTGATLAAAVEFFRLADGANSVTTGAAGQTIDATALTGGKILTLAGSHAATVNLTNGNLTSTSSGNITVTGSSGQNNITTGAGADTITGGGGADTLTGGGGIDKFVISTMSVASSSSLTKINDYTAGTDLLQLPVLPVSTSSDSNANLTFITKASSGTSVTDLTNDIGSAVTTIRMIVADRWTQAGDTIVVTLTGDSFAATGLASVRYVVQNLSATDDSYSPNNDTVVALVGTSTSPTAVAHFA